MTGMDSEPRLTAKDFLARLAAMPAPEYQGGKEMRLRTGEWRSAEEQTLDILTEDRRQGSTKLADRQFWLTEDQIENRYRHEVYNRNGSPDPHIHQGFFGRAHNPLMGKRPGGRFDPYGTMSFDSRVPHSHDTVGNVWTGDQWYGRSSWWADQGGDWHLDRYQRCRIRRMYRQVGLGFPREVLKVVLAEKYGVPPWVISRVAISSRTCHT